MLIGVIVYGVKMESNFYYSFGFAIVTIIGTMIICGIAGNTLYRESQNQQQTSPSQAPAPAQPIVSGYTPPYSVTMATGPQNIQMNQQHTSPMQPTAPPGASMSGYTPQYSASVMTTSPQNGQMNAPNMYSTGAQPPPPSYGALYGQPTDGKY